MGQIGLTILFVFVVVVILISLIITYITLDQKKGIDCTIKFGVS